MRHLLSVFVFFSLFAHSKSQISFADLTGQKDEDDPAAIQNRTYVEEQNALQRHLFTKYDRNTRPKRDQTQPTAVSVHLHLMHFSVQESKQSIKLFGHIYLSWYDEFATWDPVKFNNTKTTVVSQWELWQPELKVANSISGVNQYFEISKRSHSTLTSIDPNRTKVELYPTFSISVGCDFDFSDYPFDVQNCDLRFYTSSSMNEVELTLYYGLHPSVVLSWEEESNKKHISDWELVSVHADNTYFRYREYNNTRPTSIYEMMQTWSMITCTIALKRNTLNYWFTLALPGFASLIINWLTFLVYKVETALLMLVFNFFLQVIFLHDSLDVLPPSVGRKPNIVIFSSLLMFFTFAAILLQVWLKFSTEKRWPIASGILKYTDLIGNRIGTYWQSFLIWINSFGFFTIPVKSTTGEESGEYESFQEPDTKNAINGKVVLLNGVLRKVCIIAYLLLAICLSFLLFF